MNYSYDRRFAWTTELPKSFPKHEIGLMTRDELLAFRNPKDKHHSSDAYDFDLVQAATAPPVNSFKNERRFISRPLVQ